MESPSNSRTQDSDLDLRTLARFSLCDESSDDDNELVGTEQWNDMVFEVRDVKSGLLHVRELLGVLVRRERCAETKTEIAAR